MLDKSPCFRNLEVMMKLFSRLIVDIWKKNLLSVDLKLILFFSYRL